MAGWFGCCWLLVEFSAESDVVDAGGRGVELLGCPFLVVVVPVGEGFPELIGDRLGIVFFQGFADELTYLVHAVVSRLCGFDLSGRSLAGRETWLQVGDAIE